MGYHQYLTYASVLFFSSPYPPTVKQQQDLYDFSHQITTAGTVHLLQTSKCVNVNDKTFKRENFWVHS